jgi:hypothetical protein
MTGASRAGAQGPLVKDLDPEAVDVAGSVRMTVVLENGSGATILLSLDDLREELQAAARGVRPLQLDLAHLPDVARAPSMLASMIGRRQSVAAMLPLHLSWHCPDAAVPEQVEATASEHGLRVHHARDRPAARVRGDHRFGGVRRPVGDAARLRDRDHACARAGVM